MTTVDGELAAIRADAERRVAVLRRTAARLWPDRDDGQVLSELTGVLAQLRAAEAELRKDR